MTKILDASYRAKQDKINYGVNNMGYGVKSCKNNTITEIEILFADTTLWYFYFCDGIILTTFYTIAHIIYSVVYLILFRSVRRI
jgi:hypothetical protein